MKAAMELCPSLKNLKFHQHHVLLGQLVLPYPSIRDSWEMLLRFRTGNDWNIAEGALTEQQLGS